MTKTIFTVLTLLMCIVLIPLKVLGQSESVTVPSTRITTYDIYGTTCDIEGDTTDGSRIKLDHNLRFSVLERKNVSGTEYYLIKVWNLAKPDTILWLKSQKKALEYKKFQDKFRKKDTDLHYVLVEKDQIESRTEEFTQYSKRMVPVAGPLLIPVKLRKDPFDFNSDISFGAAIGFTHRTSKQVENNRVYYLY